METNTKERVARESRATIRKASKHGVTTQKMMSFKVDLEVWEKLTSEANKGRLINELLKQHYKL